MFFNLFIIDTIMSLFNIQNNDYLIYGFPWRYIDVRNMNISLFEISKELQNLIKINDIVIKNNILRFKYNGFSIICKYIDESFEDNIIQFLDFKIDEFADIFNNFNSFNIID